MGRKARLKEARRVAPPPPVGKKRPAEARRFAFLATAAALVTVFIVVGVLVARGGSSSAPPPASVPTADRNASADLVKAADAVGFQPNVEPGVGEIEGQPASAAQPPANPNLLAVGAKAPVFTLATPTGQKVSLEDYRGRAVLLEFFATWCPHCAAEAPHLATLARSLAAKRYAFLSVNADGEDAASVFAYHRYFGLPFPALLDPSAQPGSFHKPGAAGPVTESYRVRSYPTFYVVDPQGRIAWASDGEQPDALLRQQLTKAAGG
jgi:peroxiredoxin